MSSSRQVIRLSRCAPRSSAALAPASSCRRLFSWHASRLAGHTLAASVPAPTRSRAHPSPWSSFSARTAAVLPDGTVQGARAFSSSQARGAEESPDPFFVALRRTKLHDQIESSPDAKAALRDFRTLMLEKGFDATKGMPSKFQLLKLAASPDFMTAAKKVMEELKKVGIDVTSPEAMQALLQAQSMDQGDGSKPK